MLKEKASSRLSILLFIIYSMNCFGKLAFSAVTVALIDESILTKTEAGIISGSFWLIYAIGQILGGVVADRFSPYILLYIGLVGSCIADVSMAFLSSYLPMLIVWLFNGLILFGVWPAILRIVSTQIIECHQVKTYNYLAYCAGIGSILGQFFTFVILSFTSWRYIFICCSVVNLIAVIPTIYAERKITPILLTNVSQDLDDSNQKPSKNLVTLPVLMKGAFPLFALLCIIKALLDTGIKNWMPTILMETYNASPSYTSFLAVLMLAIGLLGVGVGAYVYRKMRHNEVKTLVLLYTVILPMTFSLLFYKSTNLYFTTAVLSITSLLIYASGQSLLMNYPSRFSVYGGTAFVGGIMNCFAAIGNVFGSVGNGVIADNFGWNATIIFWNVLVVLFILITIYLLPLWKKFISKTID